MLEKLGLSQDGIKKWVKERAGIKTPPLKKSPDYMRKWGGKWYWTGALITTVFLYEVVTGLVLLLYYNPASPYSATEYVLNNIPFGALLLSTHLYGAYAMIVLVYVHMFRNYFVGAYKKPREIQWIIGVILLALTLGVGYFGYSLTGDVLSYNAQDVGKGIAGSIPVLGTFLVNIGFGNGTDVSLFSRFLGWHIIMAALIFLLFGYHFYLAEVNTMVPSGKESHYRAPATTPETPSMKSWYPYNLLYLTELGMLTIGFVILVPSVLGLIPSVPILLSPFPGPSPTSIAAALIPPYPPWFLLFAYKAVDFSIFQGPTSALQAMTVFTVLPLLYFLLIPFLDRGESLHPFSRPITTSLGILSIVYLIVMSLWGAFTPSVIISPPVMLEVLIPPAVVTIGGMFVISRLWRSGRLKIGSRTIASSYFIFVAGLIAAVISLATLFGTSLKDPSGVTVTRILLSLGSISFLALGTAKATVQLPDVKMKGNHTLGYGVIVALLVITWGLVLFAAKLSPYHQEMLVGVILGTVFILAGMSLAVYRRIAYRE